ncbi:Myb family DNA-binding domain-containing protein [Babesia ovis]|uniref:Myb family DNA-binding domain-containing protein n=1 Tax=Babesia ovis TaxID=5869 RepID=A0A9W5TC47_BABOV|nr:Myb family DNA-binding domain-containing protein [Babesia ovis]
MESLKKESLELASAVKTRVRDVRGSDTNRETVWERVQRLGRNQDPFERPTSVEQTQSASNVDLSFFGADVQCLLGARHHVVGSSYSRGGQYASAYRRSKSVKWSAEDTTRFYEAVRNFGSDLLMVRSMLPEFTDKQLYGKFKIEEKRNPERLHKALNSRTRIPVDKFEKRYGKIDSSRHYDPTKDPVLLHKKNQKTNQLALRTQVEGDQQSPSVVPQEELHIADVDEAESDVQACNIMQLFM